MAQRTSPLESTITKKILKYINSVEGCHAVKKHGSVMGSTGEPDIDACMFGRCVKIEVKRPGQKPTERQELVMAQWRKAGAVVVVATCIEDVQSVLALVGGTHKT